MSEYDYSLGRRQHGSGWAITGGRYSEKLLEFYGNGTPERIRQQDSGSIRGRDRHIPFRTHMRTTLIEEVRRHLAAFRLDFDPTMAWLGVWRDSRKKKIKNKFFFYPYQSPR